MTLKSVKPTDAVRNPIKIGSVRSMTLHSPFSASCAVRRARFSVTCTSSPLCAPPSSILPYMAGNIFWCANAVATPTPICVSSRHFSSASCSFLWRVCSMHSASALSSSVPLASKAESVSITSETAKSHAALRVKWLVSIVFLSFSRPLSERIPNAKTSKTMPKSPANTKLMRPMSVAAST